MPHVSAVYYWSNTQIFDEAYIYLLALLVPLGNDSAALSHAFITLKVNNQFFLSRLKLDRSYWLI